MSQPTLTCEGIAAALFGLLSGLSGVRVSSRRLLHWSDVPPEECPAIFLSVGKQTLKNDENGLPVVSTFDYVADLYVHSEDPTTVPSTLLNTYLEEIKAALQPVPMGPPGFPGSLQVLGDTTGRIRHAWITDVETDEGVLGPRAIATVHIEVELA